MKHKVLVVTNHNGIDGVIHDSDKFQRKIDARLEPLQAEGWVVKSAATSVGESGLCAATVVLEKPDSP